ncbi:carboxymuconolactone decarboxylase [Massilia sp. WF1]|uniref:carboxymuconolactone decarboxylase family protein n=1 Tax=unclassified Massilia TaxID=2609279 RepID=UPI000649B8FD|nr:MULTISPECIES: carboxymuconolactone decarboxylase family protein [unclassified Massilia]ALK98948.1 carboxymuconolactone decarboxylase [Massilia sp. WG5]KLU38504.1 carboxymuconolactone decarboxylase [Massilia sp. WF1]
MTDRLRPIPADEWTDAQREAAHEIVNGPRGALYGPFVPLLRSPELMGHAQRLGEYLRYRSAIGTRLSELAILVTAREWNQQVEWAIHAPVARQAGVKEELIGAIARRERPQAMAADEEAVYEFCVELQRDKRVSDRTYDKALALFGAQGVVDLMGVNGYYTFLAMIMNGAQTEAPPSSAAPLPE